MKNTKLAFIIFLIFLIFVSILPSCETPSEPDEKPVKIPSEPLDKPPPPPPPPPKSSLAPLTSNLRTLESIASDVLRGYYGPELQLLLADEITKCVNKMSDAGMLSAHSKGDRIVLRREGSESQSIMYSDGYLLEWILNGRYGRQAMTNLHSFIRSLENEKVSAKIQGGIQ